MLGGSSRRLAAALMIGVFVIGLFATTVPVQATFTLGDLSGTSPYDVNNFDPHLAGPVGFVWPGAGQCAWDGFPNRAGEDCSPGYQAPYPNGNPPGAPDNTWYQLQGDSYSPFGAVLAGSTGDLIFGLNATCPTQDWYSAPDCATWSGHDNGVRKTEFQQFICANIFPETQKATVGDCNFSGVSEWTTWIILIPPEFTVPGAVTRDASQIVSTLSNSYSHYLVVKLSPEDRYAPGWTLVAITADGSTDWAANEAYYTHPGIEFTQAGEWYYARINGVTAPSTAGRYFFKMALYSGNDYYGVGPSLTGAFSYPFPTDGASAITKFPGAQGPFVWVPPQNWPVMLVKGEVDPAIITGTLRYAGYNASLYQQPIGEAAFLNATMTERINPYTGQPDPTLPLINAQAYINNTANGHYEIEGLASGIYNLYASAAGYPTQLCASGITALRSQSLHFDCYLQPGPVIHGNVFTKHQFGDEPWPGNSTTGQYIKIELYANPTLNNNIDPSAGAPISWSPLPCVAGGQEQYEGRGAAGLCGDPRDASAIAFPWHEYSTVVGDEPDGYGDPANLFTGSINGYSRDVVIGVCPAWLVLVGCVNTFPTDAANSPLGVDNLLASDPEGVGPPQHWFVSGGTTTPFHFEMGVKGEYGAPTDLSGEVPQVYATWINGLTPGRYYVRAWTFRYVQTSLDGSTFQEYYFDITPNEWAGDVTLPIDLRLSSWVNKTVYFHDTANALRTNPIQSGAGFMWGTLTGADGHVYSANVTGLGLLEQNTTGIAPQCFSGNNGFLGSCYSVTSTTYHLTGGQPVEPNYYYPLGDSPSFPYIPYTPYTSPLDEGALFGACFSFDQYGYAMAALQSQLVFGTNFGHFATGETGAPSRVCPFPTGKGDEVSALDKAGLNANSIATGIATIQFWGINDTWGGENYGIPSGTYTPNVGVNGYGSNTPPEDVSVTLSGNPTSVSDHLFLGPGFNVSVYSIDWERPRVSRDWVWSGCQYSVFGACAGSEIDVGWYPVVNGTAGTLADYFGAEATYMPETVGGEGPMVAGFGSAGLEAGGGYMGGLFQGPGGTDCIAGTAPAYTCAQMDGGGRNVLPGYSDYAEAYFGQSAEYAFVGGYTVGLLGFNAATSLKFDLQFTLPRVVWPLHFNPGEYNLAAYTYGYIQDNDFTAYAQNGQVADMKINLIIGVNVTLDILFKKESIITGTPYNMSARVRLFNDQGELVAEWMSSEGTYVDRGGHAIAANGQLPLGCGAACNAFGTFDYPLYPFGNLWTTTSSGLNGYNFLPGGVTFLHVLMAGLPQQPPYGSFPFGDLITGTYFGDPVATGILPAENLGPLGSPYGPAPYGGCDFELDCYSAAYGQYPFPYTGIAGAPDYAGGWTAEVDFVPWYANNTSSTQNCQSASGLPICYGFGDYYPPVNGLLMGESDHIIPGTTATSGVSLTEDMGLSSTFLGHSVAANHLGPYSQEGVWQIAGAHNSGEASAIFEVDLNGFVSGNVLAFTWSNEFRTLSWGTISITGAPSGATWNFYTYDGMYQAFLPTGNYKFTIAEPGFATQTLSVVISPGQTGTGQNVYLEQNNIPVPEFSTIAFVAFSALATSVYTLKRRRR